MERELIREYQRAVRAACEHLDPRTARQMLELAESPDLVRGYEEIKLANVERFRTRITELFSKMESVRTV